MRLSQTFAHCILATAVGVIAAQADSKDRLYIDAPAPTTQPKPEYNSPLQYPTLEDELKAKIAELELRVQALESHLSKSEGNLTISSPGSLTIKSGGELILEGEKVTTKNTFTPK